MAEIIKRSKPLAVNPLKVSQPIGAALAFLGLHNSIPMLHGSQGCTAFGKVFFVRHFREPIDVYKRQVDQLDAGVLRADAIHAAEALDDTHGVPVDVVVDDVVAVLQVLAFGDARCV